MDMLRNPHGGSVFYFYFVLFFLYNSPHVLCYTLNFFVFSFSALNNKNAEGFFIFFLSSSFLNFSMYNSPNFCHCFPFPSIFFVVDINLLPGTVQRWGYKIITLCGREQLDYLSECGPAHVLRREPFVTNCQGLPKILPIEEPACSLLRVVWWIVFCHLDPLVSNLVGSKKLTGNAVCPTWISEAKVVNKAIHDRGVATKIFECNENDDETDKERHEVRATVPMSPKDGSEPKIFQLPTIGEKNEKEKLLCGIEPPRWPTETLEGPPLGPAAMVRKPSFIQVMFLRARSRDQGTHNSVHDHSHSRRSRLQMGLYQINHGGMYPACVFEATKHQMEPHEMVQVGHSYTPRTRWGSTSKRIWLSWQLRTMRMANLAATWPSWWFIPLKKFFFSFFSPIWRPTSIENHATSHFTHCSSVCFETGWSETPSQFCQFYARMGDQPATQDILILFQQAQVNNPVCPLKAWPVWTN
ncbi:hypothetical protein VP01_2318g1 [Puccinia sorghi]|uniref:Uncharacterized protein n=1 Tax=Puccinia sorghi TaxID=27349 RepID=A0A0L6V7L0_9BASI|nr:hypothetical protein VP01_2318g1 [Puccinia sorghi]